MAAPMLWKLINVRSDAVSDADFAAALAQHLRYTPAGFVSILLQIKAEQSAYVLQPGCAGCAVDRCVAGCRVALLRRVLRVGYADSTLVPVRNGLLHRPYTRAVVAWPSDADAEALDAGVLNGYPDARLQLHWRIAGRKRTRLEASARLQVGEDGDDPVERLRDLGWRAFGVPPMFPWLGRQPRPAPRWIGGYSTRGPHVLTPSTTATNHRPSARSAPRGSATIDAAFATSYGNAATIVQHMEEAGARIELLDLEPDDWTAQVVATTAAGGDAGMVFEAMALPGSPLAVRDAAANTVALDPAQTRSAGALPPLIYLGTRPDARRRWRPLSTTHHLVLAGVIEAGVIAGMLAPAVQGRPDLHVGVVDLSEAGAFNLALQEVPGRLPTTDGRSTSELLGVIGSLRDHEQPVVVVLHAEGVEQAESALMALLRAAMYRPLSVVLVVPGIQAIPAAIQDRCPLVVVRERVARVQAPEGSWEWAYPTVLRLPWRPPEEAWSLSVQKERREPLLPREGFWVVPRELQPLLTAALEDAVPDMEQASEEDDATPGVVAGVANDAPPSTTPVETVASDPPRAGRVVPGPATMPNTAAEQPGADGQTLISSYHPPRRCRVYEGGALVARTAPSSAAPSMMPSSPNAQMVIEAAPTPQTVERPVTLFLSTPSTEALPPDAPSSSSSAAPTRSPAPSSATSTTAYAPREDSEGNLIVDDHLLVLALQWAEQVGQEAQGVPITRFKRALNLPTKAHSYQLRDALRLRGLIRREVRDGWYRLISVHEAVRSGKLPFGPWYVPPADDLPGHASTTSTQPTGNGVEHRVEAHMEGGGSSGHHNEACMDEDETTGDRGGERLAPSVPVATGNVSEEHV